jgi:hypothetical protein
MPVRIIRAGVHSSLRTFDQWEVVAATRAQFRAKASGGLGESRTVASANGLATSTCRRFKELHEAAGALGRCEERNHDLPRAAALAAEFLANLDQREVIAEMSA